MLSFNEYITEEQEAKAYVATLLEEAASKHYVMTDAQRSRMKQILELFPDILKRNRPQHVTHLRTSVKPDLNRYDGAKDE